LMALMDEFPRMFEIVEPRRAVAANKKDVDGWDEARP
jgi:hypothetical protein